MIVSSSKRPEVKGFFDPRTWSIQYVAFDPETRDCVIIDPVLDFDEKSGSTVRVTPMRSCPMWLRTT